MAAVEVDSVEKVEEPDEDLEDGRVVKPADRESLVHCGRGAEPSRFSMLLVVSATDSGGVVSSIR